MGTHFWFNYSFLLFIRIVDSAASFIYRLFSNFQNHLINVLCLFTTKSRFINLNFSMPLSRRLKGFYTLLEFLMGYLVLKFNEGGVLA